MVGKIKYRIVKYGIIQINDELIQTSQTYNLEGLERELYIIKRRKNLYCKKDIYIRSLRKIQYAIDLLKSVESCGGQDEIMYE